MPRTCFACGAPATAAIEVNGNRRSVCAACSTPDAIAGLPVQETSKKQLRALQRKSRASFPKPARKLTKKHLRRIKAKERRQERQAIRHEERRERIENCYVSPRQKAHLRDILNE